MKYPLLYEINTRCWLNELAQNSGKSIHLGNLPATEYARWRELGFTHIWLMGAWTTGIRSAAASSNQPIRCRSYTDVLPDCEPNDVVGSPYAIAQYKIPPALGGEKGLNQFRRKLHAHGMRLLLDFVPNHVGLDHPWLYDKPDFFVQSPDERPETFRQYTREGSRWIAHGKDPFFPAWVDTAQLDYRRPDTRQAMIEQLQTVARLCDGVRCDMTMLLLKDVFARTWREFPGPLPLPATEFWVDAIQAVKESAPEFLFLGEAYWDLEPQLQTLGFDYTYDKRLYDLLLNHGYGEVQRHLLGQPPPVLAGGAHFLENHDEPRAASLLKFEEHRAAALTILGLPGMRLLHEGQLDGAQNRTPVQLGRRRKEAVQPEVAALYQQLLSVLQTAVVGQGEGKLLSPRAAWADNPTAQNFIIVQWQRAPSEFDLVVANLAPHRSQCYAPLAISDLAQHNWQMKDLLSAELHQRRGDDLEQQGLYLDVPAHGAQLFHFQPII